MGELRVPQERTTPVFVLVDDDREATHQIALVLPSDWFFVMVHRPALATRYAKRFATTAILLADPIGYPRGGAARLLQELLDEVERPVIVLSEEWNPEIAERWQRMGARACISHPTRSLHRMSVLREALKDCILPHETSGGMLACERTRAARHKEEKT